MSRPKVYLLQEPLKNDGAGQMVPMFDFRKVIEYGEIVICMPSGRISLTPGPTIDRMKDVLRNFTDEDFVVPVGDMSAVFAAAMVICDINRGRCKLLKWDKNSRGYVKIQIDLNHHRNKGELTE